MSSYAQRLVATPPPENSLISSTISALNLQKHPEGGYFVETDRDRRTISNPFISNAQCGPANARKQSEEHSDTRNASTTIFYMLTPASPVGHFHRNKGRTIHTLHHGRGTYTVVHADEVTDTLGHNARVETFIVGPYVTEGERLQWIVEGGKYKTSFLLPDRDATESGAGCLISETVIPGFEFADHDFLTADGLRKLVGEEDAKNLAWLLRREERVKSEASFQKKS